MSLSSAWRPCVPALRRPTGWPPPIVIMEPNASIAPIHDRIPLVFGPGESGVWLGDGFEIPANRGNVQLSVKLED